MASITNNDQMIWRKLGGAKNKQMSLAQVEASFPNMAKKAVTLSLTQLIKAGLVRTEQGKEGVIFHHQGADDAKKRQANTKEQTLVLGLIQNAGNRGISAKKLRIEIGPDLITPVQLRKAVDGLEKSGQITSFKGIQQPTIALYILAGTTPAEDLAGGIWYDAQKEYDAGFVDIICRFLLLKVQAATFPSESKRTPAQKKLVPNPIFTVKRTPKLPSPHQLLRALQKSKVVSANLTVKNVMECMRALELDGLVEAIKPVGGVKYEEEDDDSEDERPSKRRRKAVDSDEDDLDEDELDRRRSLEREKERAKLKEKKRKAREREREEERAQRRKDRKKRKKDKDKKKRKSHWSAESDDEDEDDEDEDEDEDSDSDVLVDLNDLNKKKKKKRSRSGKSRNGKRKSKRSDDSESSESDSETASSSESQSDSDDSDVSSVASDDIDQARVAYKPKTTAALVMEEVQSSAFATTDLTSLSDTQVVYRATNRYHISLGQNQAPCGKCPQFSFCEGDGPVNPESCDYFSEWLADVVGGWDAEGRKRFKPEEEELENGIQGKQMNGANGNHEEDEDEDEADQEDDEE